MVFRYRKLKHVNKFTIIFKLLPDNNKITVIRISWLKKNVKL